MVLFWRLSSRLITICSLAIAIFSMASIRAEESVTLYPTYGYQQGQLWNIPVRLWVHERRSLAEFMAATIVAGAEDVSADDLLRVRTRLANFLADSESNKQVSLTFDNDPLKEQFQVRDADGAGIKSDLNGLIEGTISLSLERVESLLRAQKSTNGWLTLSVSFKGHAGRGRVRLIDPEGVSVVSDIDDTIKVSEIPAGSEVVMRNTFVRPFRAAPEMSERYRAWDKAAFHYVSGGPWQMYEPLSEFLIGGTSGFPEGSFHMQTVRKNLLSSASWNDLRELMTNDDMTYNHKVAQITTLLERFPKRRFILVGDSGEKDPEVYRAIQAKFPKQVQEIWIRDVVNDREIRPERLSGMNVIPATTVTPGVSEFSVVPGKN